MKKENKIQVANIYGCFKNYKRKLFCEISVKKHHDFHLLAKGSYLDPLSVSLLKFGLTVGGKNRTCWKPVWGVEHVRPHV